MVNPLRIAIIAYPGCFAAEIFAVIDLLTIARRTHSALNPREKGAFDVRVVAREMGPVAVSGPCTVNAVKWKRSVDVIVVPGFELDPNADLDSALAELAPECRYLKSAAKNGTKIGSICTGAFLLGEAGLLSDRRATTSWLFANALALRYPACQVDSDEIRIEDGPITTTAAFSASAELAIGLVNTQMGYRTGRSTAKIALIGDSRTSQAPYVETSLVPQSDEDFARSVCMYLARPIDREYDLAAVASALHVSARTLLRRFKHQTGTTPLRYLQQQRISRAKELLEHGTACDDVMRTVGYEDPAAFRRLFLREVGIPPGAYRRQFSRL